MITADRKGIIVDLSDFLLARIAEDEEAARDAAGWDLSGRKRSSGNWRRDGLNSVVDDQRRSVVHGDGGPPSDYEVDHIARWNPARVIADCDARRRIVEQCRYIAEYHVSDDFAADNLADETLAHLALPYADHPDYRSEWAP